ncbi:MAG: hypothetical protein JO197_16310 [Acidobacteria bacterium]|nr:hypothetical protein [Acidobacteriota bacterium]MBV9475366.1 hypothetical protein [Acidobacteriota bacterium]
MKRLLVLVVLAAALPLAAAEPPLTNQDIVEMTKAGLSAETIVAKIRHSEVAFHTDSQMLIELVGDGVADAVIRAMIEQQDAQSHASTHIATTPAQPQPATPAASPAKPMTAPAPVTTATPASAPAPAPAPRTRKKHKRIDEVSVATDGGGRCDHATLDLSSTGLKTTGCHETDVDVAWKDVQSVCYVYSFRSTLVIGTANGERRIYTSSPAELKALHDSIRAFAPGTREESSCH